MCRWKCWGGNEEVNLFKSGGVKENGRIGETVSERREDEKHSSSNLVRVQGGNFKKTDAARYGSEGLGRGGEKRLNRTWQARKEKTETEEDRSRRVRGGKKSINPALEAGVSGSQERGRARHIVHVD